MTLKSTPLTALAALAAIILLSACGSTAKASHDPQPAAKHTTTTASPPPSSGSGPGSLALEYAQCMRSHRIPKFPNPVDGHLTLSPSSGVNPDSPIFQAAAKACAKYGPSGGASPGGGPTPTANDGSGTKAAAVTQATWDQYADWLKQQTATGQFSGSVLIADHNKTMLDAGYGYANRATRAPNTPQTLFCIASIGKLFTAVAIGQLAERHKLSFDALVGRYLSGLPARIADHVTIGDLLDMTSGLDNVVLGRPDPPRTLAAQVALIAKEPLRFTPGAKTLYSNDGFILLGAVVRQVSGESYSEYLRQHILDPAGMTDVGYSTYIPTQVSGMAHGYALVDSKLKDVSGEPQIANPSGGAYATSGDLLEFARALLDHKLLTPVMTATILTPRVKAPQPGGPPLDDFTYGFAYQQENGVTFLGHNGGTSGYADQIDIYPHSGYIVVILTNQDDTLIPAIQRSEQILTAS